MKKPLTLIILLLSCIITNAQSGDDKIALLENQKKKIELEVKNLTDSIARIDLKITQIKSKEILSKVNDSSITVIARKGTKLKKDSFVYADIITTFEEDKEVIILDFRDDYFKVCQGSLCGYVHSLWIKRNNVTSIFIKFKETEKKQNTELNSKSSTYNSSLLNSNQTSNPSYKASSYSSSRNYYRGPRGGCYYINPKGNKSYVARNLCN
ncbi:hypothetical protein [Cellulophaga sp. Z1A5H]|uniref:hypothetical protein n=1 Tax=Cellulophaga sp. Z1A5H TaxID=2687291 RepID=UPI0013FE4B8E|nr:hypothetical protein [Cellulophaga sp. Z1A5H]